MPQNPLDATGNGGAAIVNTVNGALTLSASGGNALLQSTSGTVTVNGAKVVAADVAADNGVIHAIDTVLMPK